MKNSNINGKILHDFIFKKDQLKKIKTSIVLTYPKSLTKEKKLIKNYTNTNFNRCKTNIYIYYYLTT